MVRLCVRNDGGPGRFCMMDTALWPAANFKVRSQGSESAPSTSSENHAL